MLLMPAYSWVRGEFGTFYVEPSTKQFWSAELRLGQSRDRAMEHDDALRERTIQISPARDIPLLQQVLRSGFATSDQLYEFMQLNQSERVAASLRSPIAATDWHMD